MISKTLSSRSMSIPQSRSRNRGFTMVELMMSIVLMAILISLALPSYRDMVEKRKVTNGAEQIASFINTAQGVAMKTNRVVSVSYSHSDKDQWCLGAVSGTTACDCTQDDNTANDYCQIASQPFILSNAQTNDLDLMHDMDGDGAYAFDPVRGLFMDLNDELTVELRSPGEDFRLNLIVNSTGRLVLCSDDSSHAVPGYSVCPVTATPEEPST